MTASHSTPDPTDGVTEGQTTNRRHPGIPLDRSLTMLVLGMVSGAGGLVGMFVSLSRVRPEPEVFRQFPYLISAIIATGFFVVGAILVLGHFVWRSYQETRTLTRELEEAAAALMWEQLGLPAANGSPPASEPDRGARPLTSARRNTGR